MCSGCTNADIDLSAEEDVTVCIHDADLSPVVAGFQPRRVLCLFRHLNQVRGWQMIRAVPEWTPAGDVVVDKVTGTCGKEWPHRAEVIITAADLIDTGQVDPEESDLFHQSDSQY